MIQSGAGGYLTVTAGKGTALASPYALRAWAENTEYGRDDQVSTASTDGTTEVKYWTARDDHTSAASDKTGEGATKAGVLDSDHWEEIDAGELVELVDWAETRPVEQTGGTLLLRENTPRTTQTPGAVTLALNFLDNFEGSNTQRILGVVDKRVYVQLFPKGKGAGLEIRHGYMKTGEFGSTGNQTDDLRNSTTLVSDGDWTVEAQT